MTHPLFHTADGPKPGGGPKPGEVVGPPSGDRRVCSAKGCRADAAYGLRWNNPSLHTPERRKTWLACEEHRVTLAQFLSMRGFLRETVPIADL